MANPWIEAHARWYERATPAERAAFDASRSCPRAKVFTPEMFPSEGAWARFLTLQDAAPHALWTEALPSKHQVKGQVRVYDAMQDREQALAGVGACDCCHERSAATERFKLTLNGIESRRHMCPTCARIMAYDYDAAEPTPYEAR